MMRKDERERTSHDFSSWFVLVTHQLGLPFHGSPLSSCPFIFSFIEREGDGPTPLTRGEGRQVGVSSVVRSELRQRDSGGGMKEQ